MIGQGGTCRATILNSARLKVETYSVLEALFFGGLFLGLEQLLQPFDILSKIDQI
jgi:hypothetical protein